MKEEQKNKELEQMIKKRFLTFEKEYGQIEIQYLYKIRHCVTSCRDTQIRLGKTFLSKLAHH